MKPRIHIFRKLTTAALLVVSGAWSLPAAPAAPAAPPAKTEIPRSFFIYPTSPAEGKDPFFPKSTRPYDNNPEKPATHASVSDLAFQGVVPSGTSVVAIINNRTFAPGDEGEVKTKSGERLTIHCVSIDAVAVTVTIELNGATNVLHFQGNQ